MIPEHRDLIHFLSHSKQKSREDYHALFEKLIFSKAFINSFHRQFPEHITMDAEELSKSLLIETPFHTSSRCISQKNFFENYSILSFSPYFYRKTYPNYLVPFRDIFLSYNADTIDKNLLRMKKRFNLNTISYEGFVFTLEGHFHYYEEGMLAHFDHIQDILDLAKPGTTWLGCTPIRKEHAFLSGYFHPPVEYIPSTDINGL